MIVVEPDIGELFKSAKKFFDDEANVDEWLDDYGKDVEGSTPRQGDLLTYVGGQRDVYHDLFRHVVVDGSNIKENVYVYMGIDGAEFVLLHATDGRVWRPSSLNPFRIISR